MMSSVSYNAISEGDIREAARVLRGLAHRWALGTVRPAVVGRGGGCWGYDARVLSFPRFAKLTPCHVLASVEQHAMRVAC
jgi:hypothetical protein